VSLGELRRALDAGVPPERIVFAGVGKTAAEMVAGLEAGILQFNVESIPELELLDSIAQARGVRAPVAIRINPDVDARTHAKISTGRAENKFGIDPGRAREAYAMAARMPGIEPVGLAVHIGSQLTDTAPYRAAFHRLATLARELREAGLPIRRLDLGGGLGIGYGAGPSPPSLAEYAAAVRDGLGDLDLPLIFEPGRHLVGEAGILVARVLYVKEGTSRNFLIVDAAMNDLLRPALYDAYHPILPVAQPQAAAPLSPFDVVGPICESGDTFATERMLPPVKPGDLVAFGSAGAYGAVMGSGYNTRLPTPEIMIRGDERAIVRPRPDYDLVIRQDRLPEWLGGGRMRSRGAA
jgi:diaminopimelate decarboxylase